MQPAATHFLGAGGLCHDAVVKFDAEIARITQPQPKAGTGNVFAGLLTGKRLVLTNLGGVVKGQCLGANIAQAEKRGDIRGVNFDAGACALVFGNFTLLETPHSVVATNAKLLAGDQQIVGVLAGDGAAQGPVGRQRVAQTQTETENVVTG